MFPSWYDTQIERKPSARTKGQSKAAAATAPGAPNPFPNLYAQKRLDSFLHRILQACTEKKKLEGVDDEVARKTAEKAVNHIDDIVSFIEKYRGERRSFNVDDCLKSYIEENKHVLVPKNPLDTSAGAMGHEETTRTTTSIAQQQAKQPPMHSSQFAVGHEARWHDSDGGEAAQKSARLNDQGSCAKASSIRTTAVQTHPPTMKVSVSNQARAL
jgi:hypothetical protein